MVLLKSVPNLYLPYLGCGSRKNLCKAIPPLKASFSAFYAKNLFCFLSCSKKEGVNCKSRMA